MSLKDELRVLTGKKRRYMLFRVAEMEVDVSRKMANIPKGTYNSWLQDRVFIQLHRRVEEFIIDYKQEAIQMLRRDNQLSAVILEEKIIKKMGEEVDNGDYNLIRTNLARDVYTRLMGDLDFQPQVANMSWEQRIQNIFTNKEEVQRGKDGIDGVIAATRPLPQLSESIKVEEAEIVKAELVEVETVSESDIEKSEAYKIIEEEAKKILMERGRTQEEIEEDCKEEREINTELLDEFSVEVDKEESDGIPSTEGSITEKYTEGTQNEEPEQGTIQTEETSEIR